MQNDVERRSAIFVTQNINLTASFNGDFRHKMTVEFGDPHRYLAQEQKDWPETTSKICV